VALQVGDRVQASRDLQRPGLVFDEVVEEGTAGVVKELQQPLFGLGRLRYAVEFDNGAWMEGLTRDDLEREHGWGFL
jgi:hypothetical protein